MRKSKCKVCGLVAEISMRSCEVPACRFELRGATSRHVDAAFRKAEAIADEEENAQQRQWTWQPKRPANWSEMVRNREPDRVRWIRRWMTSDPVVTNTEIGKRPEIPVIGFAQFANDVRRLHVCVEHPAEATLQGLTGEEVEDSVLRKAINDFHGEMLTCSGKLT